MGTTVGRPADSVRAIELGDELSLFDVATGQALSLNRTASDVWALADGEADVDDVIAILARAYRTTSQAIAPEVRQALAAMTTAGVLVSSTS